MPTFCMNLIFPLKPALIPYLSFLRVLQNFMLVISTAELKKGVSKNQALNKYLNFSKSQDKGEPYPVAALLTDLTPPPSL